MKAWMMWGNVMGMIANKIIGWASHRKPDLQIGGSENPYLNRHYLIPRNPYFNIYVHQFIHDDDDRAEHDHPWISLSWLMRGALREQIKGVLRLIMQGSWIFRMAKSQHRLEVVYPRQTWTLFITGPRFRDWGFYCPKGWVHWKKFTAGAHGETIGHGCGED